MNYKQISLLTALILFIPFKAFPQPFGDPGPSFRISSLHYENSSGEKATTCFHYDRRGWLSGARWSLDDSSRFSVNRYEHDAAGNLVFSFREFSDGLFSFERFGYDQAGNKISEAFFRSDSVKGTARYRYQENRLVEADFNHHKGWLSGTLKLEYDDRNRLASGNLLRHGNVICTVSYQYDSLGNLVREHWDFGNNRTQTFRYLYMKKDIPERYYSSPLLSGPSSHRITREDYSFNNEVGGPSTYNYGPDGRLFRKDFKRDDGLVTHTWYTYDPEGRLVSSTRHYPDSTRAVFKYLYDENSRLIRRDCYKADSLAGFESYVYGAGGVLEKGYLKHFDGWLSGTIDFHADALGVLTGGTFRGEDGFDASLRFHHHPQGMIGEITWDFSFGKFQRYTFEYGSEGIADR
jgi:YD repeat-containing protein